MTIFFPFPIDLSNDNVHTILHCAPMFPNASIMQTLHKYEDPANIDIPGMAYQ